MARWRVLTWNIRGSHRPDLALIGEVIAGQRPDVVLLQEVRRSQAVRLAQRLGSHVYWARKHYPWTPVLWWLAEGLAVLSPRPVTDGRVVTLTPDISSWIHRHRVVVAATVAPTDSEVDSEVDSHLRVYNVHLSTDDRLGRIGEAERVQVLINVERPALCVMGGDLNDTPAAEIVAALAPAGLVDPGGTLTNPAGAPTARIDYVLVPRDVEVTDRWTPEGADQWGDLSDHLPVVVEFIDH